MKKKIPFFDYPRLWNDNKEEFIKIIDEIFSEGGFILQKALNDFETQLANYTKSKYFVGVGNATDAMEIFLQAIGINKGDEIIISSHTMIATASAIKVVGAIPVPVDIGEDNLICANSIEEAITSRTVGIMPSQLNGRVCDMDAIKNIANKNNLFIVEDAAQALGAKYKDQYAGTFGLASCISFFPAKLLGCFGDGGGILVSDQSLFDKIYKLRDHGRDFNGDIKIWGRNSRLDNFQAAILSYKLKSYNAVIARRREIAQIYQSQLENLSELQLPPAPSNKSINFDVYQNYEITADKRDDLKQYLSENNIGTLIQWGGKAIHHYKELGFTQKLLKTDKFFERCIMLPMNMFINNDDIKYICDTIKLFYKKN